MNEKLPCPFCGNKGGEFMPLFSQMVGEGEILIGCNCCFAKGPFRDNYNEAVKAWNTRNSQNNIERNDSGKERQPCGEHNKQSESLLCPKCGSGRTDKLLPRALCRECGQTWLR